jgi:hypothetical protein
MLIGKFRLCTQKKKLSGDNFLSDIPLNWDECNNMSMLFLNTITLNISTLYKSFERKIDFPLLYQGLNVRHNVGCGNRKSNAILFRLEVFFYL